MKNKENMNYDDVIFNENVIFYIANHTHNCSKICGLSPETVWNTYIPEDIKSRVEWSEINKYLIYLD